MSAYSTGTDSRNARAPIVRVGWLFVRKYSMAGRPRKSPPARAAASSERDEAAAAGTGCEAAAYTAGCGGSGGSDGSAEAAPLPPQPQGEQALRAQNGEAENL
mmetsp:Transcript_119939/g.334593  ORF Transcript_119939/g.334593 Transcript_119939/m.334593 type:complete len:103 (-) Transcript_119939:717-1025(-)